MPGTAIEGEKAPRTAFPRSGASHLSYFIGPTQSLGSPD